MVRNVSVGKHCRRDGSQRLRRTVQPYSAAWPHVLICHGRCCIRVRCALRVFRDPGARAIAPVAQSRCSPSARNRRGVRGVVVGCGGALASCGTRRRTRLRARRTGLPVLCRANSRSRSAVQALSQRRERNGDRMMQDRAARNYSGNYTGRDRLDTRPPERACHCSTARSTMNGASVVAAVTTA